jgi:hypothetical protein
LVIFVKGLHATNTLPLIGLRPSAKNLEPVIQADGEPVRAAIAANRFAAAA